MTYRDYSKGYAGTVPGNRWSDGQSLPKEVMRIKSPSGDEKILGSMVEKYLADEPRHDALRGAGANARQVAGNHYKGGIEHWDYVAANKLNYFEGQITKYVTRCRKKNGLQDLQKAMHFLEKYVEVYEAYTLLTAQQAPLFPEIESQDRLPDAVDPPVGR